MTGPLFPENYSKIWIRGRFITMAGVAVRGKLTLAPTVTGGGLVNRSLKLIMSAAAFSADTDNDGYVALQVPATNDPDITPINFTYSVTTPIGQKFSIVVPYDTTPLNSVGDPLHGQPVIELIDVVPVGSSGGVGQLLRGIGIQSIVDNGAGGLLITYSDGATFTVAMPDTVVGPPGPAGSQGPLGPVGPTGPAGVLVDGQPADQIDVDSSPVGLADLAGVTATGAAVGDLLAVSEVTAGTATGFTRAPAPTPAGNTVVLLGDSLVNRTCILPGKDTPSGQFPPAYGYSHQGFWAWTQVLLRHRMTLLSEAGISGELASQIRARISTDVTPLKPAWCVVRAGTNDILASNTPDPAPIIATITGIVQDLRRAGIRVALFTVSPIGGTTTAARDAAIARVNRALFALSRDTPGCYIVNTYSVLADPGSGRPITGMMEADGVHHSPLGSAREGKVLAAVLSPLVAAVDELPSSNIDPVNLLSNGQFLGDTAGMATSWSMFNVGGTAAFTPSKIASIDDHPGEWQQIVHTSGSTVLSHAHVVMASAGLVQGDQVYAQLEFETDPGATITNFFLDVRFRTVGEFQLSSRDLMTISTPWPSAYLPRSGVLRTPAVAIPATTDRVEVSMVVDATALTYRLRRVQLVKV